MSDAPTFEYDGQPFSFGIAGQESPFFPPFTVEAYYTGYSFSPGQHYQFSDPIQAISDGAVVGSAVLVGSDLIELPPIRGLGGTELPSNEFFGLARGSIITGNFDGFPSPPVINGLGIDKPVGGNGPTSPFSQVSVIGPFRSDGLETVTVTPSSLANGMLTDPHLPNDGGSFSNGAYTITGSDQTVTSALQGLVFSPAQDQVSATTVFTIGVADSLLPGPNGGTETIVSSGTVSLTTNAINYVSGAPGGFSVLEGTPGNDVIDASARFNAIFGNGGTDRIDAGAGNAFVSLGSGNATVTLSGSGNLILGANGTISVVGLGVSSTAIHLGNGSDAVDLGGKNDTIVLGNGNDTVTASSGMAFITTGSGNDAIVVGARSTVDAGRGANSVVSTGGSSTFVLPAASRGFDTITGFTEGSGDKLNLTSALGATDWTGSAATLGRFLQVSASGDETVIELSKTGVGFGTPIAELHGAGNLTFAELVERGSLLT